MNVRTRLARLERDHAERSPSPSPSLTVAEYASRVRYLLGMIRAKQGAAVIAAGRLDKAEWEAAWMLNYDDPRVTAMDDGTLCRSFVRYFLWLCREHGEEPPGDLAGFPARSVAQRFWLQERAA